jgi:hypothetical protein
LSGRNARRLARRAVEVALIVILSGPQQIPDKCPGHAAICAAGESAVSMCRQPKDPGWTRCQFRSGGAEEEGKRFGWLRQALVRIAGGDHAVTANAGISFLAGAILASFTDLLADGLAPSWLVRVGTCLCGHFPGRGLRLCLGRPGRRLRRELGRFLALLPRPAAKETHGAIVDR